ncbi:SAM-dependent methyltransferase [Corallincola holothuriorum]|uniref:SAM-dependent methyltransferase n=1 Tax=Corallincola holothuriorum TaxID=2282215 RepID=A0A368NUG3_9GAMM|nr:class I SAM-dependent methyltransferase [Corallincola holothuriorum]RCU52851.1 SAM-dependent methyltransferase [Corallincola holothuriorum]
MNCTKNILSSLLKPKSVKNAERLLHGRGQLTGGAESIAIDWYASHLLFTFYSEVSDDDVNTLVDAVVDQFRQWQMPIQAVLCQRRYLKGAPVECLHGEVSQPLWVTEHDLQYKVNLLNHQNHGLFLDMAEGRKWVLEHAKARSVLNLFSYTCGFSVAALAGGADSVVNLDMSKGALSVGKQNHVKNDLHGARFLGHDLFNSWGKLKRFGPYGLIIVDPPSFQGSSFTLDKHYPKVIRRLSSLAEEGADILLCLNAPEKDSEYLTAMVEEGAPELSFVQRLPNPAAFADRFPEKALKVLHYRYGS